MTIPDSVTSIGDLRLHIQQFDQRDHPQQCYEHRDNAFILQRFDQRDHPNSVTSIGVMRFIVAPV